MTRKLHKVIVTRMAFLRPVPCTTRQEYVDAYFPGCFLVNTKILHPFDLMEMTLFRP